MSRYSVAEAERLSLREELDQRVADLSERIDRMMLGDDAYEHYLSVSADVHHEEERRREERMREIIAISERNRRLK